MAKQLVKELTEAEFVEANPEVKKWLAEKAKKSKSTAVQYSNQFFHYALWLWSKGYKTMEQLLLEYERLKREVSKGEYRHIDLIKDYLTEVKSDKGKANKNLAVSAIRSFYKYNRCELPHEKIDTSDTELDRQLLREKVALKPMTLEDFKSLISPMRVREKSISMLMLQSGMGEAEFCGQFNVCTCRQVWLKNGNGHVCEGVKVMKQLNEGAKIVKVELVGRKSNPNEYHTYLGHDAITLLKQYLVFRSKLITQAIGKWKALEEKVKAGKKLGMRDKQTLQGYRRNLPHLTPVWQEGQPIFVTNHLNPITPNNIQGFVRHYKVVTGLSDRAFTPHNIRDLFKTEASHVGVEDNISEYFIGHKLDKYGYNQLDKLHPEDFEEAYLKVEANLNIISHTTPKAEVKKVREENLKLKERLGMLEKVVLSLANGTKPSEEEFNAMLKQMEKEETEEKPRPKSSLRLP